VPQHLRADQLATGTAVVTAVGRGVHASASFAASRRRGPPGHDRSC
jgi:hypothetical protein